MGEEAGRELTWREVQEQRRQSTIPADQLPAPRLELRWRDKLVAGEAYCDYNIVLPLTKHDIRNDGDEAHGPELRFRIAYTRTTNKRLEYDGVIEVPYRDGSHILWDSRALGVPAYIVLDNMAQRLLEFTVRKQEAAPTVEERENLPVDSEWARKLWQSRFRQAAQILASLKEDIELEGKLIKDNTLFDLYLHDCAQQVEETLQHLRSLDPPRNFEWWLLEDALEWVQGTKRVCEVCGTEVPADLTEACEHILDEGSKRVLGSA